MALVAYDNSDSSDYEDDKKDDIPFEDIESKEQSEDKGLSIFNRLPQPTIGKKSLIEEDDEFLHKKVNIKTEAKPKPKIMVPSLSDFKDVEDSIPSSKPKTSGKKSGLLSLLPQPKNGVLSITKPLIPHVLTQKPHTSTVKKKSPLPGKIDKVGTVTTSNLLVTEYSDESDNEDVQNDFFSINKPVQEPSEDLSLDIESEFKPETKLTNPTTTKEPRSIESYFKKEDDFVDQNKVFVEEKYVEEVAISEDIIEVPGSSNEAVLDEEAIMKLCGSRGKRKREEIQIVDVNQQEVLNEARQLLLKGLMDDTSKRQSSSKKRGNEPTSQQRRKHQITYLAHQAKANEAELQNQWANNRMTKRKTQSKYGF